MSLFTLQDIGIGDSATARAAGSVSKDIFAEKTSRKDWRKKEGDDTARCDLSVERIVVQPHAKELMVVSLWKKSLKGRHLTEIKEDDSMVDLFASKMTEVIRRVQGTHLDNGTWAICATPKRRHLTKNFACRIAAKIGENLHLRYYEDVAISDSRERVNKVYTLGVLPDEPNLIIFDDFVTTGSTLLSMKRLLEPLGKNLVFFVGINNNM